MSFLKVSLWTLLTTIALIASIQAIQSQHALVLLPAPVLVLASACCMQKTVRLFDFRRPTIPGFWYVGFVAMNWIPSLFIFCEFTPSGYSYPISAG